MKEFNLLVDFLKQPYMPIDCKKKLCDCGEIQTHSLNYCNICGGSFYIDAKKVSRATVAITQSQFHKYHKGIKAFHWFEELYKQKIFTLTQTHFSDEEFKDACYEATKYE